MVGERLQARAGAFQPTTIKYPAGICNSFKNGTFGSFIIFLRKRSMSVSTSSLVGIFNTVTFAPSEEMIASERVSLRSGSISQPEPS